MLRPHCFFIAAVVKKAVQIPVMYISTTLPRGSTFRLDYILVSYTRITQENIQVSPELSLRFLETAGIAHNNQPIPFRDFTTPGGGSGKAIHAAWSWRVEFPPGAIITMEVTGQNGNPTNISMTYLGVKSWGKR